MGQIFFNNTFVDHSCDNCVVAFVHKSYIVNLIGMCSHGVHDSIEINDFSQDVVMLIYHN